MQSGQEMHRTGDLDDSLLKKTIGATCDIAPVNMCDQKVLATTCNNYPPPETIVNDLVE